MALSQSAAYNPSWSRQFWQWIHQLESQGFLDAQLLRLLQGFGYVGMDSVSGIHVEAMKAALSATSATPISLSGALLAPGVGTTLANPAGWTGDAEDQYYRRLPADLQRAAVEIYRSIRNEGVSKAEYQRSEQDEAGIRRRGPGGGKNGGGGRKGKGKGKNQQGCASPATVSGPEQECFEPEVMKEKRSLRQDGPEDEIEAELKKLLRPGAIPLFPLPLP